MGVVAGARRERRATGDAGDTEEAMVAEGEAQVALSAIEVAPARATAPALLSEGAAAVAAALVACACVVVRTMVMRATGRPERDGIARTNTFCTTTGALAALALPKLLLLLLEFAFGFGF